MYRRDTARRLKHAARRAVEARQTPRHPGLQGLSERAQRLRRPALHRLYQAVPRVGPEHAHDAVASTQACVAAAPLAQAAVGESATVASLLRRLPQQRRAQAERQRQPVQCAQQLLKQQQQQQQLEHGE